MEEREYLRQLRELWSSRLPAGLPEAPTYPLGERPLTEYLREWARLMPDRPMLIYYGRRVTYAELNDLSDRFAALLLLKGLLPGDRVAVLLPNCPQNHVAFFGTLKAGCVLVPLNPLASEDELARQLKDSGTEVLVTLNELYPIAAEVAARAEVRQTFSSSVSDFVPDDPPLPPPTEMMHAPFPGGGATDLMASLASTERFELAPAHLDSLAVLNYTSGTTGVPKGCEHTQRSMLYTAATGATYAVSVADSDVLLSHVPVFWTAGEVVGILAPLLAGVPCVLLARWDADAVLAAIPRYGVTVMLGTVDDYVELMEHPDVSRYALDTVHTPLTMSLVRKLTREYRQRWMRLVGEHSVLREAAYGLTETHSCNTTTLGFQDGDFDLDAQPMFTGLPMPGTDVKIINLETGKLAPLGVEGEIAMRAPSLMRGYWNDPQGTTDVMRDGWLYTGDVGIFDDDGLLHFLGRRSEMLTVSGLRVFPAEVENLLGRYPAVHACAVLGRPDTTRGQVPVAFVELRPEYAGTVTAADIEKWCRDCMATHKVPDIRVLAALPRTASGMVAKVELADELG